MVSHVRCRTDHVCAASSNGRDQSHEERYGAPPTGGDSTCPTSCCGRSSRCRSRCISFASERMARRRPSTQSCSASSLSPSSLLCSSCGTCCAACSRARPAPFRTSPGRSISPDRRHEFAGRAEAPAAIAGASALSRGRHPRFTIERVDARGPPCCRRRVRDHRPTHRPGVPGAIAHRVDEAADEFVIDELGALAGGTSSAPHPAASHDRRPPLPGSRCAVVAYFASSRRRPRRRH